MSVSALYRLCVAAGLPEPEAEYRFAPPRRFRLDLAWPEYRACAEQEGGVYGRGKPCPLCKRRGVGAHTSVERLKSDMEKYNLASIMGWALVRFRPEQVRSGEALTLVESLLRARGWGG